MATIRYQRVRQREAKLAKMNVSHDGVRVGAVSPGKDLIVDIEPGTHLVEVTMQRVCSARVQVIVAGGGDQLVLKTGMSGPFDVFVDQGEPGSFSKALEQSESYRPRKWWQKISKGWWFGIRSHPAIFAVTFVPAAAATLIDRGETSDITGALGAIFVLALFLDAIVCTWLVRRGKRGRRGGRLSQHK